MPKEQGSLLTLIRQAGGIREDDTLSKIAKIEENSLLSAKIRNLQAEEEARHEELRLKRRETEIRLNKLDPDAKKESDGKDSGTFTVQDLEVAKALEELPLDEKRRVLTTMQMMKTKSGSNDAMMGVMLMGMMGGEKRNGHDEKDTVITVLGKMLENQQSQQMKPADWVQLLSAIRKENEQPVNKELNELVVGIVKQAMDQPNELESFSNSLKQLKDLAGTGGLFNPDYKALELQLKQNEDIWRRDVGLEILKRKWDLEDKKLQYEAKKGDRIEKGLRTVLESVVGAVVEEDEGKPVGDLRATRQNVIEYACGDCNRKFKVAPDVKSAICPGCGRRWNLETESEPEQSAEHPMTIRRAATATGKSPLPEESQTPSPNVGNSNEDSSFSTSRSEGAKKSQAQDAYNSLLDGAEQQQQ